MSGKRGADTAGERTRGASDTAIDSAAHGLGGRLTAIVSALALVCSGISLYQSVIKQADLHLYLPESISYTRDPDGSYEVFVLPVTVTNSGARDGIVSSLTLTARNIETGATKTLSASYFTADGYFSTKEDVSKNQKRPKEPFAPLSVPGRSAYTGTILFYPRKFDEQRVVKAAGRFQLTITAKADGAEHFGYLDRLWTTQIKPLTVTFNLPAVSRYFTGRMLSGHTVRLFREGSPKAPR